MVQEAFREEVAPRQRGMTPVRVTLAAGIPKRFDYDGDYFHVLTAPVDDLEVRFDDGEPVPARESVGFRRYYRSIELSSATGQAVLCFVGFGSVSDGRASANVSTTVNISPGNTLNDGGDVVCPAVTATQLLAADPDRLYALLKNGSANTITVRIGTADVGAADGTPLEPGETLPLATTAAIYAYNPHATDDVTISASSVAEV